MRKEKIPHQAPFTIQDVQLLGRVIGEGLFAITPAGERGMCCKAIKLVKNSVFPDYEFELGTPAQAIAPRR
jgi:hypothetical protein